MNRADDSLAATKPSASDGKQFGRDAKSHVLR